jgi:hypothetical protein
MMDSSSALKIYLPRYNKVKLLVLKYSSLLKLQSGVQFRVCNVCSKRLQADLSDQHSKHLKTHQLQWNNYLVQMRKAIQESQAEKPKNIKHIPAEDHSELQEPTSSSDSEEDVFNVLNAVAVVPSKTRAMLSTTCFR